MSTFQNGRGRLVQRAWADEAIRRIEADANRSADTHLHVFPLPAEWNVDLYLKDESVHPTGSLKHRLARSLFLYGLCNGWIVEGTTIVEASTGSTAVSEAYFARFLGLPFVAVMPASTSPEKIVLIEAEGGSCHLVEDASTVYDEARELAAERGGYFLDQYDRRMCRILAYLGEPLPMRSLLFDTDNSLVQQSYSPRMMNTFLNLAGFGMTAWDPTSLRPEEPFTYHATTLPSFDRNLRRLSSKLAPTCLVAHVRGVTYSGEAVVADTNLHPFHFAGARIVLAHNGHLRQFARMRYALLEHVRPELAQHIKGTTDSEWIYALILSQLDDPFGVPETRELADATATALRILRSVRAAQGIDTSSPVNLCISTGRAVVATRVSLDYGWYPPEDEMLETDLPFVSLWYAIGGEYTERDGDWAMTAGDPPRSVIIASEPLTADSSTWFEVPEYSMLTAELTPEGVEFETRDLDV